MYSLHILKDLAKNQLAKFSFLRKLSSYVNHNTGINGDPNVVAEIFQKFNQITPVLDKTILELGPGHTYQVMEMALAEGAVKAAIIDINQLIDNNVIKKTGIEYKIYSGDIMPYPDNSFNIIWSHTVYEHLRFPLTTIKETHRVLKPGGVAVHHIDMRDHLILDENNARTFNMLSYSEELWNRMAWNRSIYVNRLRLHDWIRAHEDAGFKIVVHEVMISQAVQSAYKQKTTSYLSKYSEEDAITSQVLLSAEKSAFAQSTA